MSTLAWHRALARLPPEYVVVAVQAVVRDARAVTLVRGADVIHFHLCDQEVDRHLTSDEIEARIRDGRSADGFKHAPCDCGVRGRGFNTTIAGHRFWSILVES